MAAANKISNKVLIEISSLTFEIYPNGKMGYAFILHNELYEINLSQFRSTNKDFYPIMVKIKSECLWSLGPKQAWQRILNWVQNAIGVIKQNKISRIDLCCHTDKLIFEENDINTFKGNFFNDQIFRYRRKVSGVYFGNASNKLFCRIYNKTLEVKQKRKKVWFFNIWNENGLDCEKIWNVEFQINRTFLKEYNIESVEDAFHCLKTIWKYCTEEWLVKVKLDRTRIERCTIDDTWILIQKAFDAYSHKELIRRELQLEEEAEMLLPNAIGNITTYAARKGIPDISLALPLLISRGNKYLSKKQQDFNSAINKKIALLSFGKSEVR